MIYKLGCFCCWILVHILYRVRLIGTENIPRTGGNGFVLVANHRSNMDPVFIAYSFPHMVRYMAKQELFSKNALLGWLMRHLGAFPVARGTGDTSALDLAAKIIREGGVLGMFPEGTRSPDGTLQRPKSGAAMIALQTGADVLPCAVCFGEKLGFRTRVTVRYAPLIKHGQLGFTPGKQSPREIKEAGKLMMGRIAALLEEGVE